MKTARWLEALGLCIVAALYVTACGGGGGGSTTTTPPPSKVTPTVTVTLGAQTITTLQSLSVTIAVSGSSGTPTGTVTLSSGTYTSSATTLASGSASITVPAGTFGAGTPLLSATYTPDASASSSYNGASGTAQVSVAKATPTVSVLLSLPMISTIQSETATITVSGGTGAPTPTGTVSISGAGFFPPGTGATLSNGTAQIVIPAGAMTAGSGTLTANYTPDSAGSAIYNSSTGTAPVTVNLAVPTVSVTPGSSSIVTSQSLQVTVAVSGGSGALTPTGSITLSGGGYNSSATTLASGSAQITVPANSFTTTGSITLTASYTPDTSSKSIYASATGTAPVTVSSPTPYALTVNSLAPSSGITIAASPADNNSKTSGVTPFALTYNGGTQVTLTAALSANSYSFVSWTGCTMTSGSSGSICTITFSGNTTVTANYNQSTITSVTVTPSTATIGTQQQFTANVQGTGSFNKAVTWSMTPSTGAGSISSTGLYNTPYPAPANVTITATSVQDTTKFGSTLVTLSPPATTAGPALSVDLNTPNTPSENPHTISPYVYGMNAYVLDPASEKIANPGLLRWGGDDTSRYNYQYNMTNSASDYYFENFSGAGGQFPNATGSTNFPQFVQSTDAAGSAALGTVPVLGWVANNTQYACSFTQTQFPTQQTFQNGCGNGVLTSGADLNGSNGTTPTQIANITSVSEPPPCTATTTTDPTCNPIPSPGSVTTTWANGTWSGGWVNSIAGSLGTAGSGTGVAMWDLDNEPTWWDAVHRDVHPIPFTYDEVTNNGIGTALAIKTADPTALVSGPVIDNWWAYFYSKKDIESGWSSGSPCYQPWGNPTDREAHAGIPLIEYYLQQFAKYSGPSYYNTRLLDYVDIHGYFAPDLNGNSVAFTTAGDTQEQIARMNGTRVFWDPTYTDPNYPQPNYLTDPNYRSSCSTPLQAPQLIPMLKTWVANDYPGTKTAIDEYNFGGLESINGAVVQADILGIFGRQDLDMGAFWPSTNYLQQGPGNYAFAMYRNYDGSNSVFGNTYLQATSTPSGGGDGENQLAVYAAQRTSDSAITVMVINKTYGPLTSTINLQNFSAPGGTTAKVYQYSNANLSAVVSQPAVTVTPPTGSGTTSTISSYSFPGQSITLFVVP